MRIGIIVVGVVAIALALPHGHAYAETYPEFNGNYIKCKTGWCKIDAYQLNVMGLWEDLSASAGRRGSNLVVYSGYFTVPEKTPSLAEKRPRFLTYTGRSQADPSTVALVELAPLPFNGSPIDQVDEDKYHLKARYSTGTLKHQLWTYKRELVLRYRPVDGKIGMFVFEPDQPLSDGFYVLDSGIQRGNEHVGLETIPEVMGFDKYRLTGSAIPFVIGNKNKLNHETTSTSRSSNTKRPTSPNATEERMDESNKAADELGKTIDGLLQGIFRTK